MDPLEILPSEMWAEIFVRVKDEATDWHNLYNASPSFQNNNVAKSGRAKHLFPLVLPHLTKYLIKGDDDDDNGLKALLPLRRVSRRWRQGVDSLIERKLKKGGWKSDCSVLNYNLGYNIHSFLEKFETHPSNPFIGSTISLHHTSSPRNQYLMHKFGAHLKGLRMMAFGVDDSMLLGVGKVLKLCPALEHLSIACGPAGFSSLVVQRLSTVAEFPLLPKLKSLDMKTMNGGMTWSAQQELQNCLLRICCNPDSLTEAAVDCCVPSELVSAMPNLKSVSLFGTTVEGLSRLRHNARWPLTQLTMSQSWLRKEFDLDLLDMLSVFRAVESFGETLTTLTLSIPFQTPPDDVTAEPPPPLALPRLKCLRMTAPGNSISCIDFLATLSKLEEFYLDGWATGGGGMHDKTRKERQIIKVPLFSGTNNNNNIINMLESNIWELLPRLRKLYFGGGGGIGSLRAEELRRGHFYSRRGMGSTPVMVKTMALHRKLLEDRGSIVGMCGHEYGFGPVYLEWVRI